MCTYAGEHHLYYISSRQTAGLKKGSKIAHELSVNVFCKHVDLISCSSPGVFFSPAKDNFTVFNLLTVSPHYYRGYRGTLTAKFTRQIHPTHIYVTKHERDTKHGTDTGLLLPVLFYKRWLVYCKLSSESWLTLLRGFVLRWQTIV